MNARKPLLGLAVSILTLALFGCAKSPESTVESFYRAVAEGEITEARGYLSKEIVGMMGEQKISTALSAETQTIQACGGITDITVELQDGAEVRFGTTTVQFANCPEKKEDVRLVQEDGDWKISAGK